MPSASSKGNWRGLSRAVIINAAILLIAALVYAALAAPASVAALAPGGSGMIYRTDRRGAVSLQCAVSWQAAAVEPMLDELKDEGTAITFAVTRGWAEANPALLMRMRDEGHEIAVMCSGAPQNAEAARRELALAAEAVRSVAGVMPTTCFCGGGAPAVCAAACKKLGLDAVYCTADLDCAGADAELLLKRTASAVSEGGIISVQPTGSLLEALPEIVNYLKNMGFAIVPTHKMLYN